MTFAEWLRARRWIRQYLAASESVKYCFRCGAVVPEGCSYCIACGAPIDY